MESLDAQIEVWEIMLGESKSIDIMRRAVPLAREKATRDIMDLVKTLSFSTEADRLELAKRVGKLDGLESVYYDIDRDELKKKIEGARKRIAHLAEEIKRAKKGELLETRA